MLSGSYWSVKDVPTIRMRGGAWKAVRLFHACDVVAVLPAIFVGIALVQFTLACVVFASLIYFVIRDYAVLQRDRRRLHVGA